MTTEASLKALEWTGERYLPEIGGSIELEHLHRYLLASAFVAGKRVLDIASGEGYGSALLASAANSVLGVDISDEAVAFAKSKYSRDNLEFRAGSCAAIPLDDHCIDVVVSFETIEHHTQHEQMMLEIKRVLTPDGILIISCPDKLEYSDRPGYSNPYHVRELYRDEFKSLLDQHFAKHKLLGQRIVYGSAVVAEEGASEFLNLAAQTDLKSFGKGLSSAVYLIAVAGDGVLPEVPSSLFEQPIMQADAVRNLEDQLKMLVAVIGDRDRAIHECNLALISARRANEDQRSNRDAMINVLADRLQSLEAERNATIGKLSDQFKSLEAERDATIGRLSDQLKKLEVECGVQRAECDVQRAECDVLRKERHEILTSTRWRITEPLAHIVRMFRGQKG